MMLQIRSWLCVIGTSGAAENRPRQRHRCVTGSMATKYHPCSVAPCARRAMPRHPFQRGNTDVVSGRAMPVSSRPVPPCRLTPTDGAVKLARLLPLQRRHRPFICGYFRVRRALSSKPLSATSFRQAPKVSMAASVVTPPAGAALRGKQPPFCRNTPLHWLRGNRGKPQFP